MSSSPSLSGDVELDNTDKLNLRQRRALDRYPWQHGTDTGYQRHLRMRRKADPDHQACRPCLDAHSEYEREKRVPPDPLDRAARLRAQAEYLQAQAKLLEAEAAAGGGAE